MNHLTVPFSFLYAFLVWNIIEYIIDVCLQVVILFLHHAYLRLCKISLQSFTDRKKASNLEAYMEWFNRLSFLVATEICMVSSFYQDKVALCPSITYAN